MVTIDRPAVTKAIDRKERRVLFRTGGLVRREMRQSIKKAGKKKGQKANPNEPPRFHKRGYFSIKDGIFFDVELENGSVVIGAAKRKSQSRPAGKASSAQLIEEGGRGLLMVYRHDKDTGTGEIKQVKANWPKQPFAAPQRDFGGRALLRNMERIPL